MPYVIGPECIGELDGACVEICPVDCIYEGLEKRYINPTECIECDACLSECPVDAITPGHDPDPVWAEDNMNFFSVILPGRSEPLGDPGGASVVGKVGVDTPLVAGLAGGEQ